MGIITDVEHYRTEQPPPSSSSYTLAELNAAAEQFVDTNDASSDLNAPDAIKLRIFLGMFLQQLGKKERKANES